MKDVGKFYGHLVHSTAIWYIGTTSSRLKCKNVFSPNIVLPNIVLPNNVFA
jgi:hypothetical protein